MSKWDDIIEKYLVEDRSISELQSNGGLDLFGRKHGKRVCFPNIFSSEEEFNREIIDLVKKINPNFNGDLRFIEEGRLKLRDGNTARVHIMLPPACDYPQITIAKKTTSLTTLENIFESGSISKKMKDFLIASVQCNLTIVLSGSTGAGKTTMLEALTKHIHEDTRIGVVEDSPELSLIQPNVTYLHSMPWRPGMNPNDEVTLDWCVRQINRMRTDRLIIGESRGKEFKEFITAANSGMEGSMTTIHANNPRMALRKMTQFIMEAQTQPVKIINKNIATTVDLIVQLTKTVKGEYKCVQIEEVTRTVSDNESAEIATNPLTVYNEEDKTWDDKFIITDNLRNIFKAKGFDDKNFIKLGNFSDNNSQKNSYQGFGGIPRFR